MAELMSHRADTLDSNRAGRSLKAVELGRAGIAVDLAGKRGVLLKLCRSLPFYYCVRCARSSLVRDFTWDAWGLPLLISAANGEQTTRKINVTK